MKMKRISFPDPMMNPCNQIGKIITATPTSLELYCHFREQTNNSTVTYAPADEKHIGSASAYYEENQYGNGGGWWGGGGSYECAVCIKAIKDCHKCHAGLYS